MARSPLERQGALVFQVKQCRNCHSIGGSGGKRGPALDSVATRMTHDQLVRQVMQGGGNMPAYGKNLNPAEVTALVSFLETLHPPNQPPARDAATQALSGMPTSNLLRQRNAIEPQCTRSCKPRCAPGPFPGPDIRHCPHRAHLSARLVAAAPRRLPSPSAVARLVVSCRASSRCGSRWPSPMDVFNSFVLTAHMLQHMVLMMVAPPLILLGAPLIPLVRGLPVFAAREFAGPFLNWPLAQRIGTRLTHPVCRAGADGHLSCSPGTLRACMNWRCARLPGTSSSMPASLSPR